MSALHVNAFYLLLAHHAYYGSTGLITGLGTHFHGNVPFVGHSCQLVGKVTVWHDQWSTYLFPLLMGLRILWLYPLQRSKTPLKKRVLVLTLNCIWYWNSVWSIHSFPLPPGPLQPGLVVVPVRVPYRTVWKILILDRNTWNPATVCKQRTIIKKKQLSEIIIISIR